MPRNIAELIARGPPYDFLFFWGHTPKTQGVVDKSCLSQWFPSPFVIDSVRYATAEHWMMASKARTFGDDEIWQEIVQGDDDPARVKKLGRQVRGFDIATWSAACSELVVTGNVAKFSQTDSLRAFLLSTGSAVLVEAAPKDPVWGIGLAAHDLRANDPAQWPGQNLLGFALIETRRRLL